MHKKKIASLIATLLIFPLSNAIDISATCGIVMELESGKILWSKKIHQQMYPASTTKILTAMLLLEKTQPGEILTVPNSLPHIEEYTIGLKPGEKICREDVLYSVLLRSANDASYLASLHIGKTSEGFSDIANQRCKEIGCINSNFVNAHGLPHRKHVSTAHDLALIAREAMQSELFTSICTTKKYKMNRTIPGVLQTVTNHNSLLGIDPLVKGIKTGYTKAAGPCFVGCGELNGNKVITVVLSSKNWKKDTSSLINWGLNQHSWKILFEANKTIQKVPITKSIKSKISVGVKKPVYLVYPNHENEPKITSEYIFQKQLSGNIAVGQEVGKLVVADSTGHQQEYPLIALESSKELQEVLVQKNNPTKGLAFLSVLVGCCAFVMKKQKYEY